MGFIKKRRKRELTERPITSVVVVAAGKATRMGELNKILLALGDMPVIGHSLLALENSGSVDEVVVVARGDDILAIGSLCKAMGFTKVSKIVRGGEDRISSTLIGLGEISPQAAIAGVHDGARPCVTPELIDRVMNAAAVYGAAAPGEPVTDTIKELSDDGFVSHTLNREKIVAIQTPQAFEATLIRGALTKAMREGWRITDDCSAVERLGMRVRVVPGERANIKITVPEDLILAEAILRTAPGRDPLVYRGQ